ncbi:uncharacterized protein LOC125957242 [Anopheles darlingi]|uniref:uncharacterized protein LOC125957242 n=1 Tax=Anopheles darlingi TaxID=43151 RepID=UPI0021003899|nr:uncharacterized protein LOC125957242 [Anopheles darlingi]
MIPSLSPVFSSPSIASIRSAPTRSEIMVHHQYPAYRVAWFTSILALLLAACSAQPPQALNYPNVQSFGAFAGTICYSNSLTLKSIVPVTTRSFTFSPGTALTYVVCYNNVALHPFEATLVGGGIGTTMQTSIALTSYTGKLIVNCDAYCT